MNRLGNKKKTTTSNFELGSNILDVSLNQCQSTFAKETKLLKEDNQILSQLITDLMKEKLENSTKNDVGELREKVYFISKERDSLHLLWQTSQKTVDALEAELKVYQNHEDGWSHKNTIEEKRDLELKFESTINDYLELESQYKNLVKENQKIKSKTENQDEEINKLKTIEQDLSIKVEELNKVLFETKIELESEKKGNENLKLQLAACQKECVELVKREAEAKSKVAEALQLYDMVAGQKAEAFKKITEITEELEARKSDLATIKHKTEKILKTELENTRDKYNEKVQDMLTHVKNLDEELIQKGLQLNKVIRENKILQETNEEIVNQFNTGTRSEDPKLKLAEDKLEAIFEELVTSERRNIQLTGEKRALALDLQKSQDLHSREIQRVSWEGQLVQTENRELKQQVEHMKLSLEQAKEMINKLQERINVTTDIEKQMTVSNDEEMKELKKQLEKQIEINERWKQAYIEYTEKLKRKLKELYKENKRLRNKQNEQVSTKDDTSYSSTVS